MDDGVEGGYNATNDVKENDVDPSDVNEDDDATTDQHVLNVGALRAPRQTTG